MLNLLKEGLITDPNNLKALTDMEAPTNNQGV